MQRWSVFRLGLVGVLELNFAMLLRRFEPSPICFVKACSFPDTSEEGIFSGYHLNSVLPPGDTQVYTPWWFQYQSTTLTVFWVFLSHPGFKDEVLDLVFCLALVSPLISLLYPGYNRGFVSCSNTEKILVPSITGGKSPGLICINLYTKASFCLRTI